MSVGKIIRSAMIWIAVLVLSAGGAFAQDGISHPWQMNFQDAASPVMKDLVEFHNFILILITLITLFVLGLLIYIIRRFNVSANPVPSKTTHNTVLEVLWTVVPIIVLLVMIIPAFELLYNQDDTMTVERMQEQYGITVDGEITLKATAIQWAWMYDYPDHGVQDMDAFCSAGPESYCMAEAGPDDQRLLETTNRVVVPVNTLVRVLVTSDDVIHAWAVPAFGVKIDAVPGRTHETWFVATREGVFYGQCSELCGTYHAFMPIAIDVVSQDEFKERIAELSAMYPAI